MTTSPLCEAIRFRDLGSQITKQEFHQFISQIDQNEIFQALFCLFKRYPNRDIQKYSNILTKIITSRNKTQHKHIIGTPISNTSNTTFPLTNFSRHTIGDIASFLHENDHKNFSYSNRHIYLGCNAPNTIKELQLNDWNIRNKALKELKYYPHLTHLSINYDQLNELNNNQYKLDALNSLQLELLSHQNENTCTVSRHFSYQNDWLRDREMQLTLLDINFTDFDNITHLYLTDWGERGGDFQFLGNFLSKKFRNITYLSVHSRIYGIGFYLESRHSHVHTMWDEILPNLKGLQIIEGRHNKEWLDLISEISKQLEYLYIDDMSQNHHEILEGNFGAMRELTLNNCMFTTKFCEKIIKTGINLEKLSICTKMKCEGLMVEFMKYCMRLRSIQINNDIKQNGWYLSEKDRDRDLYSDASLSIIKGIISGLLQTQHTKRKEMKVRVHFVHNNDAQKLSEMVTAILNLAQAFITGNIEDFAIILDWRSMKNEEVKIDKILLQTLDKNVYKITKGVHANKECARGNIQTSEKIELVDTLIVITNKECKINGYGEIWRMRH